MALNARFYPLFVTQIVLDKLQEKHDLLYDLSLIPTEKRLHRCGGGGGNSSLPSLQQQTVFSLFLPLSPTK